MKRTPLTRKTKLTTKAKPKAKKRSTAEFARVYGSKARVAWVQKQPCVKCRATPCENAHIISGGMGRKADYTAIVPLCTACHRVQHSSGWSALGYGVIQLTGLARAIEDKWQRHLDKPKDAV